MKYVITGGAGFIGSHIAEVLWKRGDEVVILDNFTTGKKENLRPLLESDTVSCIEGSVTNPDLVKRCAEGADGIFHLAAIASVQQSLLNPAASHEVNVTGTLNVLLAARECGVRKVVFASSAAVYGDGPQLPKQEEMAPSPISPYAATKLAGEHYCRAFSAAFHLPTVILRYFNVYGPRQDPNSEYAAVIPRFINRILNNQSPMIFGDGEQTRDFVYIGDVVQANMLSMENSVEGVFNIAYGEKISLNALVATLKDLTGTVPEPVYQPRKNGDILYSVADIQSARTVLGYTPEYPVKRGLQETLQWYRNKHNAETD
jgi:UDP-glucose 4-epimerase